MTRLLLLLVAVGLAAPAGAGAAPSPCRPRYSHTIRVDHDVRIYSVRPTPDAFDEVYACHVRFKHPVDLGWSGNDIDIYTVDPIVVRGRYVAWDASTGARQGTSDDVGVADLRTGRSAFRWSADEDSSSGCSVSLGALVLDGRGDAAWTIAHSCTDGISTVEIHTRAGGRVPLAKGPAIDATSLTLTGHTLAWVDGDEHRTAPIR